MGNKRFWLFDYRERDVNPLSFLYGTSVGITLPLAVWVIFQPVIIIGVLLLLLHPLTKWLHTKHKIK